MSSPDPYHNSVGGSSTNHDHTTPNLYPTFDLEIPTKNDTSKSPTSVSSYDGNEPLQTSIINSDHAPSTDATEGSSQRTASTGSIQDSLNINDNNQHENSKSDTDSILSSLTRRNKNLSPIFTRDYFTGNGPTFPSGASAIGKGWKGLSSLEKSLSVSLGVVSTLAIALMIAVIVVGVQLNEENNCKLVALTSTTACPVIPSTTPIDDRCKLERPRPPRRTTPRSSSNAGGKQPSSTCLISSELHNNSTICLTLDCFRMAGRILESIDFGQDPCENFYQFACGGGIENNPVLERMDQSRIIQHRLLVKIRDILETNISQSTPSSSSKSLRLAQQYYHSCMNPLLDDEVVIAEMRVLLDTMTSVPTTPAVLDNPPSEISSKLRRVGVVLANMRRFLNGNYLIKVEVEADDRNSSENAIYLSHPEPGLSSLLKELDIIDPVSQDDFKDGGKLSQQKNKKNRSFYRALVKKLWSFVHPDVTNLEELLTQMEEFEEKLKRISVESVGEYGANQENPGRYYNPLSELEVSEQLSPTMVGWLMDFTTNVINEKSIASGEAQGQQQKKGMPNVIVKNVNYFKGLEEVLIETSEEIIVKYLKLRIFLTYGPHSGDIFTELFSEFKRKVEGPESHVITSRWQGCAQETNNLFGWAVSYQLVLSSLSKLATIQQKLNETAVYLKDSLNETLSVGLPWISSNETRQVAQRKLEMIQTFVGFPTDWMSNWKEGGDATEKTFNMTNSDDFVEDFYIDMNFSDPLNYMQNYVEMRLWLAKKELAQVFQPTMISEDYFDTFGWPKFHYPSSSNAVFSEKLNYLVLPVGFIDTSVFSTSGVNLTSDIPSVEYGSLGVLMAQLILEGFDEQGSFRTGKGSIESWWDTETRENFRNLTDCFNSQYDDMQAEYGNDVGVEKDKMMMANNQLSRRNKILRKLILQSGALDLAYQAYHSKTFEEEYDELLLPGLQDYTPEQLFFLTFAQSQCSSGTTNRMVVENALENSAEFAKHWKCFLADEPSSCRIF